MYKEALQFALRAHKGQYRKESLVPYIVHPIRVANTFTDETLKTIAVLHDVIEDTNAGMGDMLYFGKRVAKAVGALTKGLEETHFEYIERVKENKDARLIKISDIVDNLSDCVTVCSKSMSERYIKSLEILIN